MDLSYEETMRRIESYEKNNPLGRKYCKEKKFPWYVDLYKGENQIIVVPLITSIGYLSTDMAWHQCLTDTNDPLLIGKTVFAALERIRISPVDARTRKELDEDWFGWHATKCKSYKAFNRKYINCGVIFYEDGSYKVSQTHRIGNNNGYGGMNEGLITLPNTASALDIGNAVIESFTQMEMREKSYKPDPYPPKEIELLCGKKLTVYPPRDRHFTDMEDGSAAEIYQLYEYSPSEDAEATAAFYLGIAAELDCNISEENICSIWEKSFGEPEVFEIKESQNKLFSLRVEMKNKNVHRISYLAKLDESELLECTMELKSPNRRKKLDERLSEMFEEFAFKCKYVE